MTSLTSPLAATGRSLHSSSLLLIHCCGRRPLRAQKWCVVEILGVHHAGNALQDIQNLRPFPALQPAKFLAKVVAEQRRGFSRQAYSFVGDSNNNAPSVLTVAIAMNQLSFMQPLENPGYRG